MWSPIRHPLQKRCLFIPLAITPAISPLANHHIDIGFGRRNGDGLCVARTIDKKVTIFDIMSSWKAMCEPILLCVSFDMISVSKLGDMIICLWMCKGGTYCTRDLLSKLSCTTTNKLHCAFTVTVWQWERTNKISDKINWYKLSEWCHTGNARSSQCEMRICLYENHHAAFIQGSNCITLHSDRVQIIEILKIASGMSWRSRNRSWIRTGEEVWLY
jgi:hypothetical protein